MNEITVYDVIAGYLLNMAEMMDHIANGIEQDFEKEVLLTAIRITSDEVRRNAATLMAARQ